MPTRSLLQRDFFIYVPNIHYSQHQSSALTAGETLQKHIPKSPNLTTWVRIPLTAQFVIYARLGDEDEGNNELRMVTTLEGSGKQQAQ